MSLGSIIRVADCIRLFKYMELENTVGFPHGHRIIAFKHENINCICRQVVAGRNAVNFNFI